MGRPMQNDSTVHSNSLATAGLGFLAAAPAARRPASAGFRLWAKLPIKGLGRSCKIAEQPQANHAVACSHPIDCTIWYHVWSL